VLIPFTYHVYDGVEPPKLGEGVKVTGVPEQMEVEGEAAMLTVGVTKPVTVKMELAIPYTPAFPFITLTA
jgi:hypothetical protein